jgi:aryl-alcohol dehydrogenase-like predicted oxidoreductase
LGIGIVAYSPLGRGFLSATFSERKDLKDDDWRLSNPRFSVPCFSLILLIIPVVVLQEENFEKNFASVTRLKEIALKKNLTPGQMALAWLHNKGDDIFPIPGTKSAARLLENVAGASVVLSSAEIQELEIAVPEALGGRYPEGFASTLWESKPNF